MSETYESLQGYLALSSIEPELIESINEYMELHGHEIKKDTDRGTNNLAWKALRKLNEEDHPGYILLYPVKALNDYYTTN